MKVFILNIGGTCVKMGLNMLCLIICANNKGQFSITVKWTLFKRQDTDSTDDLHVRRHSGSFGYICEN